VSEGPFSRLFAADDEIEGGAVVLKFPKARAASDAAFHAAFVREAWVGARVHSPWLAAVIEPAPGRQTSLYTVMPLYQGELLETRLSRRPAVGLEEGRAIAVRLAHGLAALHRAGVIHRDVKPDNVMLEDAGTLKLLDLGVVRLPGLEDDPPGRIPGTLAYMAPEMFTGEPGAASTDIYALGVTLFRAFAGEYPYGNLDATSRGRLERPKDLCVLRPDLPAWLGAAIGRAIAADPTDRFPDMTVFAEEMEAGPPGAVHAPEPSPTLYQRHPVIFWQALSALLALALAFALLRK
jgi:serine/threonine protein kinase